MTGTMITAPQVLKPAELIAYISRTHHEVLGHARASLLKAKEAGEALLNLKEVVKHGEFEKAVEMECESLSIRTARTYMSIAAGWDLIIENVGPGQASQLTISDGMRQLCKHKKPKPAALADFPLSGEGSRIYEVLNDEPEAVAPNPRPDAIKVAPHPAAKGASHQAKQLFVRVENMYQVLLCLLGELEELSPVPANIINPVNDIQQSHMDFEAWRDAAGGWEDE